LKSKRLKPRKKPVFPPSLMPAAPEAASPDPCLTMLRKAAMAEREAILFYLDAANMVCRDLQALFLNVAEDEMRHFVMTMHHISALDPVQAKALEEAGLDVLVMPRSAVPKWTGGWPPTCSPLQELPEPPAGPSAQDMTAICLLTKAINSELAAINLYQGFMEQSASQDCCEHFCQLMNSEKHHVAQFIAALYELTCEPPPLQEHDGNIM
jgi:rubrerythrin